MLSAKSASLFLLYLSFLSQSKHIHQLLSAPLMCLSYTNPYPNSESVDVNRRRLHLRSYHFFLRRRSLKEFSTVDKSDNERGAAKQKEEQRSHQKDARGLSWTSEESYERQIEWEGDAQQMKRCMKIKVSGWMSVKEFDTNLITDNWFCSSEEGDTKSYKRHWRVCVCVGCHEVFCLC